MFEKETQVMLDLETMSTASNACICSIGAVKFNTKDGILDEFYITVDAKDCKKQGLHFSQDTLNWWSKQNPAALKMLVKDTKPLKEALTAYSKWFGTKKMNQWGNGSAFDNVILRNAYAAVELKEPWTYRGELCYRTLIALFPESSPPEREGTYHNALDDAKYQAKYFIQLLSE
jgi:hypothetical protein